MIRKPKNSRYYHYRIKVTRTEADGERHEYVIDHSAHTTRKREARELENEHRRALRLGQVHPLDPWPPVKPAKAPTLKDYSKRFLEYIRTKHPDKPGTARFYEDCLKRTLNFHPIAEIPMSNVTGELIGKYVSFRQSLPAGNSIAALNAELRTPRRCFRLAEEWGLIPKAPVVHELPGKMNRERVVSFEEERTDLRAASSTLRDMATLAVDTGLRPNSELFRLRWANVHLEASPDALHGFLHVPGGKTDAARRNVPLTPRVKAVLEMRRSASSGDRYVFPGTGKSGHIVTVQHAHERCCKRAGVEPFEFYCWRHTCGTRWAESGMDKFTLARLMGHSFPRVAEQYYIHVTEPHVTAGFEKFLDYLERRLVDAAPAVTKTVQ